MDTQQWQSLPDDFNLFWFRRDLRLEDNHGLFEVSEFGNLATVFIFDQNILASLVNPADARVEFILQNLQLLNRRLQEHRSNLFTFYGDPLEILKHLFSMKRPQRLYCNHDYEPYAIDRDARVAEFCGERGVEFRSFKDQVIFEKSEIVKADRSPYTVFTPYKNKWLENLKPIHLKNLGSNKNSQVFVKLEPRPILSDQEIGFKPSALSLPPRIVRTKQIQLYDQERDYPGLESTTRLGVHLRFGTISIRKLAKLAQEHSAVFLSELIWRDFFMQILFHFPWTVDSAFKPKYNQIKWREIDSDFQRWCEGKTGYPIVDAGMRELNQTGFMHNRVRMITASFLVKHLLIDWRRGERYFAERLLDFDLSANVGNWQWAAGCGCDAAPYFRIFNPTAQAAKFDKDSAYVKKWVPELTTDNYPEPMVEHKFARDRALKTFKQALQGGDG